MGGLVLQWNWVHRIIQSRCTRRVYCIIPVNLTDKNTPKLLFISFIHLHYLKFESRLVVAGKNIDKCWKLGWATDHSLSILWSNAPPTSCIIKYYLFIDLWLLCAWHIRYHLTSESCTVMHSCPTQPQHCTVTFGAAHFGFPNTKLCKNSTIGKYSVLHMTQKSASDKELYHFHSKANFLTM